MVIRLLHGLINVVFIYISRLTFIVLTLFIVGFYSCQSGSEIKNFIELKELPIISPDYSDITIPSNIAPLNFKIKNNSKEFRVVIYSKNGEKLSIKSNNSIIDIPLKEWKTILKNNKGNDLFYDIFYKENDGKWYKYKTISNSISPEDIDPFLVYRKISLCVKWRYMGIFQRNIENFDETTLVHSNKADNLCIHCHSFKNNNPNEFLFQIRSGKGTPMVLVKDNKITAINTKSSFTNQRAGITSWHPIKDLIAFTNNKFAIIYRNNPHKEVWDVYDKAGDIAVYSLSKNIIISSKDLIQPQIMETCPEWSKDGKFLYYCRSAQFSLDSFKKVRCDLVRIAFDYEKLTFGKFDTVLRAKDVDGSITQPRFSPDGNFLLFNVSTHDDFPIDDDRCELYILNNITKKYNKLFESGSSAGSWHCWSRNGRWVTFSSKRLDGIYSKPYFCYIDQSGKASKPFILPQKSPESYSKSILLYTMPELLTGPVKVESEAFYSFLNSFEMPKEVDSAYSTFSKPKETKEEEESELYHIMK